MFIGPLEHTGDDEDVEFVFTILLMDWRFRRNFQRRIWREALGVDQMRNRLGRLRRGSLPSPSESAFVTVFNSGMDDGLITLCGLSHESFAKLHSFFHPIYWKYSPHRKDGRKKFREMPNKFLQRGNKRLFSSVHCLGLILAWSRTRGSMLVLQLLFGGTGTQVAKWLSFGRRVLLLLLQARPEAQVSEPTAAERAEYQQAIAEKHPLLGTVYGAMDGLKIPIQEAHDDLVQGRYYNGWLHGHYLTNLLLFTPDGRIRMAWMGAPGSIHDSTMAKMGGIYESVERIYREDGGQVAADSAFSQYRSDAIIRSAPTGRDRSAGAREARMGTIRGQATSLRQSSEWGMRALQGSFPRVRDVLRFVDEENGENRIILCLFIHLYNWRAVTVGQNQIRSVYMPHLNEIGNTAVQAFL